MLVNKFGEVDKVEMINRVKKTLCKLSLGGLIRSISLRAEVEDKLDTG